MRALIYKHLRGSTPSNPPSRANLNLLHAKLRLRLRLGLLGAGNLFDLQQFAPGQNSIPFAVPFNVVAPERRRPNQHVQQILDRRQPPVGQMRVGLRQAFLLLRRADHPEEQRHQTEGDRRGILFQQQPEQRPCRRVAQHANKIRQGPETRMVRAQRS